MNLCSFNSPFNVGYNKKLNNAKISYDLFKNSGFFDKYKNRKRSWSMWEEVHKKIYSAIKDGKLTDFQKYPEIASNICGGGGEIFLERLSDNLSNETLKLYLASYRENLIGTPQDVVNYQGTFITKTAMRHLYHAAFLSKYIMLLYRNKSLTIVEIGGGFGNLCKIAYDYNLSEQYIIVDLPVMLCIQHFYLSFFYKENDIGVVGLNGEFVQGTPDSKIILVHTNMSSQLADFVKFTKMLVSTVALTEIETKTQEYYLDEIKPDTIYIYGQKENLSREGGKWVKEGVNNYPLIRRLFSQFHSIFYKNYPYNFEYFGKRIDNEI